MRSRPCPDGVARDKDALPTMYPLHTMFFPALLENETNGGRKMKYNREKKVAKLVRGGMEI